MLLSIARPSCENNGRRIFFCSSLATSRPVLGINLTTWGVREGNGRGFLATPPTLPHLGPPPSIVLERLSVVGRALSIPAPSPTTSLTVYIATTTTLPPQAPWCRSAPPVSESNLRVASRDPAAVPVERARETLPPCPQSAYASRVAPATSAWGWPPPPPCAVAPFNASPLLAPSPPTRSPLSSSRGRSLSLSSSSPPPFFLPSAPHRVLVSP